MQRLVSAAHLQSIPVNILAMCGWQRIKQGKDDFFYDTGKLIAPRKG
jgi:hypothetical protein